MKQLKQMMGLFLALVMVMGLVPITAAAADVLGPQKLTGKRDFRWPVPGYHNLSSCFYDQRNHCALDIYAPVGTPITASYGGTVIKTESSASGGFGKYVVLQHNYTLLNGSTVTLYSRYSHMNSVSVREGQSVSVGTTLGTVGQTGNVTGPHLDFQILYGAWSPYQTYSIDPYSNYMLELPSDLVNYDEWSCGQSYFNAIKQLYSGHNPEGRVDEVTGGEGYVRVRGWVFDRDDLSKSIELHVYIGGPAGTGEGHNGVIANQDSSDVNNVFPGTGTNHRFDAIVPTSKTGTQTVYIYALNMAGGGENILLGQKTVTIAEQQYASLDLNGMLDGVSVSNFTGYGTVDVYINGSIVANNVSDYAAFHTKGSTYEIRDFKPLPGYSYDGIYQGSRNGAVSNNSVVLQFSKINTNIMETPIAQVYNGHKYLYFSTAVTWYAAKEICESLGGHLVTISDAEENQIAFNLANDRAWIGATDAAKEGTWTWVTGEPFNYTNWYQGQPDNTPSLADHVNAENYGHFGHGYEYEISNQWNDNCGYKKLGFICEIDNYEGQPLAILTQPRSVTAAPGEVATVSVVAQGDGLAYQWYTKNANQSRFYKSSVTSDTYTVTATEKMSGRQLYCKVTDLDGNTVDTTVVTLTVRNPLVIVTQPQDTTVRAGETAAISLVASGEGLSYQWYTKNPNQTRFYKSSITSDTYTVDATEKMNGRQLYCAVTDKYGTSLPSNTVTLTVKKPAEPLDIVIQPQDTRVDAGEIATISLTATGEGLSYQWYTKNPNQTRFYKSSVTSDTYSVTATEKMSGRQLYCVVTDESGASIPSDTVTLTVETPLTIVVQPQSVTAAPGDAVNVSVKANGKGLTYQWYTKNANQSRFYKSSVTSDIYIVTASAKMSGRELYCVVKDANGKSVTSDTATITVR